MCQTWKTWYCLNSWWICSQSIIKVNQTSSYNRWLISRIEQILTLPLREKCPNTEFFLVRIFPHSDWIRISPYSVQMRENTEQKNFVFWHFSRSGSVKVGNFIRNDLIASRNKMKLVFVNMFFAIKTKSYGILGIKLKILVLFSFSFRQFCHFTCIICRELI